VQKKGKYYNVSQCFNPLFVGAGAETVHGFCSCGSTAYHVAYRNRPETKLPVAHFPGPFSGHPRQPADAKMFFGSP
jgi:hypothetical protein